MTLDELNQKYTNLMHSAIDKRYITDLAAFRYRTFQLYGSRDIDYNSEKFIAVLWLMKEAEEFIKTTHKIEARIVLDLIRGLMFHLNYVYDRSKLKPRQYRMNL